MDKDIITVFYKISQEREAFFNSVENTKNFQDLMLQYLPPATKEDIFYMNLLQEQNQTKQFFSQKQAMEYTIYNNIKNYFKFVSCYIPNECFNNHYFLIDCGFWNKIKNKK